MFKSKQKQISVVIFNANDSVIENNEMTFLKRKKQTANHFPFQKRENKFEFYKRISI